MGNTRQCLYQVSSLQRIQLLMAEFGKQVVFYDIPVSVVGIISDPFLTEHMMVKPEIIKLFHGIRKRDETAVCDFHEGLIPFLAGQLLVGRGGPLYHLHIAGLKNK